MVTRLRVAVGPYAPEVLDRIEHEVGVLLPRILEQRRARRQEMHELLVEMIVASPEIAFPQALRSPEGGDDSQPQVANPVQSASADEEVIGRSLR